MRRIFCHAAWLLVALSPIARAATATYNISFTATGQAAASGSFILTFDPTLNYLSDTTAGLSVDSLSFRSGASGFVYNNPSSPDRLVIGGLLNGVQTVNNGDGDDYLLVISQFSSKPAFFLFNYNQSNSGFGSTRSGIVTVTQVAATPEPSSFILLATGLLGAGAAVRRRLGPRHEVGHAFPTGAQPVR